MFLNINHVPERTDGMLGLGVQELPNFVLLLTVHHFCCVVVFLVTRGEPVLIV